MASDRAWPLALLVSACGFDAAPQPEAMTGLVGQSVTLLVDGPDRNGDDVVFDWVVEDRPADSEALLSQARFESVELTLDRSGLFVIDRWLETGAAETWTHRFYVQADPAPPIARVEGPRSAQIGQLVTVAGSMSFDPDGNTLLYLWQLAQRPRGSAVSIDGGSVDTVEFVPDVPGWYSVELEVFDGMQWSQSAAKLDLTVVEPE